jgi:hypothetical protein
MTLPGVRHDESSKDDTAMARRAVGLAALEAGEYDKALINFTEAKSLIGDRANVADLLRVTEDLRGRARTTRAAPLPAVAPPAPVAPPPLVAAPTPRAPRRQQAVPNVAARESTPTETPAPESPPAGLLLVTSNPRGLLVHVDGAVADLTPMRASVKPGLHRVALFDSDRKLYETSVDINEGAAATVYKDLSAEVGGDGARSAAAPVAATKEEVGRSVNAAAVVEPGAATVGRAAPVAAVGRAAPVATVGALDITSPGLYGMVWLNGRPLGFPPVQAGDLPVGPVKIEVRVNGVEKRAATVLVQPGVTTSVKVK